MMRSRLGLALIVAARLAAGAAPDHDRDGLPDSLEQHLLDRFAPELILSAGECDDAPAEMAPGTDHPVVRFRNGTVYGQAFRQSGGRIELHYFHLWGRDCGRAGHLLDAEHVSVLVEAARPDAPARNWRARYWYAAGHEGTICDRSTGAAAAAIAATEHGASVWVSSGKHASYLDSGYCSWGCGADRCAPGGRRLRPRHVVNLGERRAPLNGATWIESARWNLGLKMGSDFSPAVLAVLDRSAGVKLLWPELRPAQSILMAGSEVGAALAESGRRTGESLRLTDAETSQSLALTVEKTGRALRRSAEGVRRFLGYGERANTGSVARPPATGTARKQ